MARLLINDPSLDTPDNFDPNEIKQPIHEWATYCRTRKPKFKTHRDRGKALNACVWHNVEGVRLYRLNDGRWDQIFETRRLKGIPDICYECSKSTVKSNKYDFSYNTGVWDWKRERGKIAEPLEFKYYCLNCHNLNRHGVPIDDSHS